MSKTTVISDGTFDFSYGVDSNKVTTVQSAVTVNGLPRNALAWLVNGTVDSGGILPRTGFIPNGLVVPSDFGLFQGGFLYEPIDGSSPYHVFSIGGHILKYQIDTAIVTDLSLTQQTSTTPTPAPWFITLENTNDPNPPAPNNFPYIGSTFIAANPNYTGVIGPLFTPFVIPPIGSSVVVTMLSAPYTGAVGDLIRLVPPVTVSVGFPVHNQTFDDVFRVVAFTPAFTPLTTAQELNPPLVPLAFFEQAEDFLIIQAGDGITLPLFWDGNTLRRSNGLNPGYPAVPELPAATAMRYYMGRLIYAQGHLVSAGDIVKGPSGTASYQLRDSVLKVTENPLAIGGDGFSIPSNSGNIRALDYEVNLDIELAQGRLLAFTRKAIHALTVPVTRADWIAANGNNTPGFVVAQLNNGSVSDRAIVTVNGDKFYQSLEPAIRSYQVARRYFNEWGNKSISSNEQRILKFNDRALMEFATGVEFDNRMLQAVMPKQTAVGVVHTAIIPLAFEPISSLQSTLQDNSMPAWEGHWEGINVLQLFNGDFGGRSRTFAAMVSDLDGSINVWELTDYSTTDGKDSRITFSAEFPAFTWGKEFELKDLQAIEFWIDRIFGTVEFDVFYRPDADACWYLWGHTQFCAARTCEENVNTPCSYPIEPLSDGYKFPILFGKPKSVCSFLSRRPTNVGYQFQVKIVVKGWCRIRGLLLYALPVDRPLFEGMLCK